MVTMTKRPDCDWLNWFIRRLAPPVIYLSVIKINIVEMALYVYSPVQLHDL